MAKKTIKRELSVPQKHQLRVAWQTLQMPDAIAAVMGGPTKAEAREIIKRLTGKTAREDNPKRRASGPTARQLAAARRAQAAGMRKANPRKKSYGVFKPTERLLDLLRTHTIYAVFESAGGPELDYGFDLKYARGRARKIADASGKQIAVVKL